MTLKWSLGLAASWLLCGCPVCPNDPWSFAVNSSDPQCSGGTADMPPPGNGPYIQWATPRVPIGAPAIEIHGGRFDQSGLKVQLQSGGTTILTQIASNDGANLVVVPTWPMIAPMAGSYSLVVNNDQGGPVSAAIVLVQLGFGPANGTSVSPLTIAKPSLLQRGQYQGVSQFFALEPPPSNPSPLLFVDYISANGLFGAGSPNTVTNGMALAASADLDGDNTTDFVVIDTNGNLTDCRYMAGYQCPLQDGKDLNLRVMGGFSALAAASTAADRTLIAAADKTGTLYRCLYLRTPPPTAQPCVSVTVLSDLAKAIVAQAFLPSGLADIIVLNQAGQLALWRSDQTDTFTLCADCIDQAIASHNFAAMAIAEVDGKNGADLIAVDGQGVTVLLNDGQGKLKAISTPVAQMKAAQAITLGDLDNDGKPDLVLTEAGTGAAWLWLNESDGSMGDGKMAGPVPALDVGSGKPIALGATDLVALDGALPTDHKQRLVTTDVANQKLKSWQNATLP